MSNPVRAEPERQRRRKISEILYSLAEDTSRERISVGDLLSAMGDRAFGPLMLLFALPNVLPMPPGASGILGVPLIILAAQLMLGRKPWLPRVIAGRSMMRAEFVTMLQRAGPWLSKAERLLKPRLTILVTPPAEYVIGAICLILAIILALPIPLGNMLPAFAICLFSFAILERDGIWIIAGLIAFLISITVVGGVLFAFLKAAIFLINNVFM
ncbi:exopolysaccharide biosynthesis protein [Chelativorans sp. Marseille-P2723]|uniref:exopolysaccharide biosynthesis protein n=1 Tax=Chelativorans sp. Marseille-P2723 TaxID=2709133 RepID=UPI001FF024B0|nr:exopolysaccharide biosynthesis protein [Chelativorans sp. Marseille-P2723]